MMTGRGNGGATASLHLCRHPSTSNDRVTFLPALFYSRFRLSAAVISLIVLITPVPPSPAATRCQSLLAHRRRRTTTTTTLAHDRSIKDSPH